MKKIFFFTCFIFVFFADSFSIPNFYLITIDEAKEPYAMYGHTAIRVVDTAADMDFIIDWGVFNFDQPNFYLNFAQGKMMYTTGTQRFDHFLYHNQRIGKGMVMNEIRLNDRQKERFWALISWMLEPENRDYRYRFLTDNCATRPRDLLEVTLQDDLIYPNGEIFPLTFRYILYQYQQVNLWYNLLINIILGKEIDKKTDIREQMALPKYLHYYLLHSFVRDETKTYPLLGESVVLVEKTPLSKTPKIFSPEIVFMFLFFIVLLLDYLGKGKRFLRIFDICFFGLLMFFGLLILFLWGISEHMEAHDNYNIIWTTPLYIFTLIAILRRKKPSWLIATIIYIFLFFILAAFGVFAQAIPYSVYIIMAIAIERCLASLINNIKE